MAVPHTDLTSRPSTEPQWDRISEAEARAIAGDEAIGGALAEVSTKGRASADRYRSAGHPVADQS